MGSIIELNDTLQLTKEQGFPTKLDLATHLGKPYVAEHFKGMLFEFKNKKGIRQYHVPPVRNFLVENRDGKWIYWGLIQVIEVLHADNMTSGKFKIEYIYSPEEMKMAHDLIDRNPETKYEF